MLEKMTGGNFCSSEKITSFDDAANEINQNSKLSSIKNPGKSNIEVLGRETVIKVFDNIRYPCLTIEDWDKDINLNDRKDYKLYKNSGYVLVDNFRISLIATRRIPSPEDRNENQNTIFVRVPGGPGGAFIISVRV